MAGTVKLSDKIIQDARRYGAVYSRSTPKQIEYWVTIGRMAEENPDLPYNFIKEILFAQAEAADRQIIPYEFG